MAVGKESNVAKRNKFKETFGELKKVSWPSFMKVLKSTGVVLTVVIFFTALLFGMDRLLGFLYRLLVK